MSDLAEESPSGRGLTGPMKWVVLVVAGLIGLLDQTIHGWGGPILMAAAALVIPILLFRRFWDRAWFWVTAIALAMVQVPAVIRVYPLMQQATSHYSLAFVLADGLFVIFAISLVSSAVRKGPN